MNTTPDYSKCSPRELQDVAARVNRAEFPDRYAAVLCEIERRKSSGDDAATARQTRQLRETKPIRLDVICLIGGAVGFFIFCLTPFAEGMNPDSSQGIFESIVAIFIGALLAGIVGKICASP